MEQEGAATVSHNIGLFGFTVNRYTGCSSVIILTMIMTSVCCGIEMHLPLP